MFKYKSTGEILAIFAVGTVCIMFLAMIGALIISGPIPSNTDKAVESCIKQGGVPKIGNRHVEGVNADYDEDFLEKCEFRP